MDTVQVDALLISPGITVKDALRKLNDTCEKILFVTNGDKKLIGTLTDGDIRRGIVNGLKFSDSIENIMHTDFQFLNDNTPSLKKLARQMMVETLVERLPVVNERNEIVKVIRWTDFFEEDAKNPQKTSYDNQVVVMAGGAGSRLDPFTKIFPKPLIPIGNKAVIEIIMDKFYQCGFSRFCYTLNYKKEYLKLFLADNKFPYEIQWVEEQESLGTVGSLSLLAAKISGTFFVTNCDSLMDIDFSNVLRWHKEHGAAMTIIGCHSEVKIPFGVLEVSDGQLKKIQEKPTHDVLINTGVYVMEPRVISYIPAGEAMDMNQLVEILLKKEKISVFPIYSGWVDIGRMEEYKHNLEKLGGL